ncbi:MAG: hypothetical protein HQL60_02545 [Magnetococcales bacterium]|nr:hypothetical protein [Magnetococcales bacterium]
MIRAIDNIATQTPVTRSTATGYRYGRLWYQALPSDGGSAGAKEPGSASSTDAVRVTISYAAQLAAGQNGSANIGDGEGRSTLRPATTALSLRKQQ